MPKKESRTTSKAIYPLRLNHELDNEIETTFAMPLLLTINSENLKNDSVRNVTAATVSHVQSIMTAKEL